MSGYLVEIIAEIVLATWTLALLKELIFRLWHYHKEGAGQKSRRNSAPKHKRRKLDWDTLTLALAVLFFLSVSSIIDAVGYAHDGWTLDGDDGMGFTVLYILYIFTWSMAFVAGYLYFLCVIHHTFRGSIYAISPYIVALHLLGNMIICSMACVSIILQWSDSDGNLGTVDALIVLETVTYALAIFHLGYLLNRRLLLLTIRHDNPSSKFTDVQEKHLRTVTKVSVLLAFVAAIIILYGVVYAITSAAAISFEMKERIDLIAYVIEAMVGSLCIYLMFGLNDGRYRICCGQCDGFCYRKCHQVVHKPGTSAPLPAETGIAEEISAQRSIPSVAEKSATDVVDERQEEGTEGQHPMQLKHKVDSTSATPTNASNEFT